MQPQTYSDTKSPSTNNTISAFQLIDEPLGRVKKLIKDQLTMSSKAGDVNQLLEHLYSRSGKMIRPGLVLLAGKCFGELIAARCSFAPGRPRASVLGEVRRGRIGVVCERRLRG